MPRRCGAGVCGLVHPQVDQSSSDPVSSSAYTPEHTGQLHYQHTTILMAFSAQSFWLAKRTEKYVQQNVFRLLEQELIVPHVYKSAVLELVSLPFSLSTALNRHPASLKSVLICSSDHSVKKRTPSTIF